MKQLFILLVLCCLGSSSLFSQGVEDEIGFIYLKAEYMLETSRFNEAIEQYSAVIEQDPTYKDAYTKRASAKYSLKSYRGVRKDIIDMIAARGIDAEGVRLLGLSEHHLGNHSAAVNTLILAYRLNPRSVEIVEALAVSATESKTDAACSILNEYKSRSAVKTYMSQVCSGASTTPKKTTKPNKGGKSDKTPKTDNTNPKQMEEVDSELEQELLEEEVVIAEEPEIDDSVNEIIVDEDLTIVLQDGIGSRRIIDQPNILMLSEQSGRVKVKVCISKGGRVVSADVDPSGTSIQSESLKSLSVRKAKEFWFARGDKDESCGSITFIINGG